MKCISAKLPKLHVFQKPMEIFTVGLLVTETTDLEVIFLN